LLIGKGFTGSNPVKCFNSRPYLLLEQGFEGFAPEQAIQNHNRSVTGAVG
jgi:hypothetical protein